MGPAKLKKQGLLVADAVHDNRIDIPEHVVANMPPIPDASKAPTLKCECENIDMEQIDPEATISTFQLVRTETNFVHLGLGLDISGLLKTSRPYLVLFQELLFQCPMVIPCASGKVIKMDYKAVSTYSSDLFTSHEAGVGFGNGVWTTGWLSNVLTIFATCQRTDWERMIRFVTQVVCFTDFTSDRILTVAKNLLTQLTETKRDGDAMLSSMATHLSYYGEKENEGANDIAISIFQQEAFLKKVILDIESGKGKKANDDLKALQCRILQNLKGSRTFIRLGVPLNFSLRKNYSSSLKEIALDANDIWTSEHSKFPKSTSKRRKRAPLAVPVIFPFFRTPYQVETVDSRLSRSVALPIAGLSTCYLSQFIPCDILSPHPHPDFFPVTLLAEILSRTEGPIFTAVRGQGYAYGAGLSAYLWHGQLSYDVSKSSEPKKALLAFYEIVKELQTDSGIDRLCTKFDIETAQSSVAYRWVSERSSNGALLATSLRAALWVQYYSCRDFPRYRNTPSISNCFILSPRKICYVSARLGSANSSVMSE